MESNAEYNYFKEFKDFSLGFYSDMTPHYNGRESNEEEAYKHHIEELIGKLNLEIENNLIELTGSKSKQTLYLQRVLKKVEVVWEKLDWYYDETLQSEEQVHRNGKWIFEYGFQNRLWWVHSKLNDDLSDLLRSKLAGLSDSDIQKGKRGRKAILSEKIIWIESTHFLRRLFTALTSDLSVHYTGMSDVFISDVTFEEFKKHFLPATEPPADKLNWEKEKYMLVLLFDELTKKKFFEKKFASNSSKLLAIHFRHKDNPITSQQITSSRNTLAKTKRLAEKKVKRLSYLSDIVKYLSRLKKTQVPLEN